MKKSAGQEFTSAAPIHSLRLAQMLSLIQFGWVDEAADSVFEKVSNCRKVRGERDAGGTTRPVKWFASLSQ